MYSELVQVNVRGLVKAGRRTVHSCFAVNRSSITIVGPRQFLVHVSLRYVEYSPALCLPSSNACQIFVKHLWLHLPATLDRQLQHFVSHQPTVNFSIGKLLLLNFSYLAVIFNSCRSSASFFNTSSCEISIVRQWGKCHANIPSMTPQRLGNVWLILICSQISDCVFESHGIARRRYDLIMMRKSHRFYTFPFRILLLWMKWC